MLVIATVCAAAVPDYGDCPGLRLNPLNLEWEFSLATPISIAILVAASGLALPLGLLFILVTFMIGPVITALHIAPAKPPTRPNTTLT